MKKKSLKIFNHRRYIPGKDDEGNVIEEYDAVINEDKALIWPATSKLQVEMYGLRINDIMNVHYYGNLSIKVHDLIIFNGEDYKVISVKEFRRFKAMEIERI
ncbi:MAG: hypothetical protein KHY19_06960 [Coprobacillus cateniformis]|nr:hypothetical protein [Coprobacillus cateniformis]